jgi:hypothetical protein
MTTNEAIAFLEQHQPLPPTSGIDDGLFRRFDEVRKFLSENRDDRCVPLLLNVFGDGDGHGVYQLVEDTILRFPEDLVIPQLVAGLRNPRSSIRYWNAEIAANYSRAELVAPLLACLRHGTIEERMAAVAALERNASSEVRQALENALVADLEKPVKDLIQEVLGDWKSDI